MLSMQRPKGRQRKPSPSRWSTQKHESDKFENTDGERAKDVFGADTSLKTALVCRLLLLECIFDLT